MTKTVALVAHDSRKPQLLSWARQYREALSRHHLVATGTTGAMLSQELQLPVRTMMSGPLGGDMQIGAAIAQGDVHVLVFFWDPLTAQPHDPDVKALLRVSVLYNVATACNEATATHLIRSAAFIEPHTPHQPELESAAVRLQRILGDDTVTE